MKYAHRETFPTLQGEGFHVGRAAVFVKYGSKRNRPIASCFRAGAEQYAQKHPRSGPKLVAWMEKNWEAM